MEAIDCLGEPNSIDGTICVTVEVRDDFQDACSSESVQRLGMRMSSSNLREKEGVTDFCPHILGEPSEFSET